MTNMQLLLGDRFRRATATTVSVLMVAGLTVACQPNGGSQSGEKSVDPSVEQSARVAPEAELKKFYDQQLEWKDCGPTRKCADLEVPIDYAKPNDKSMKIKVLKIGATVPGQKMGSLVVNPGGPGGSGIEYASYAPFIVSPKVLSKYDVVGFDPRGVGQSSPVWCYQGEEMDKYLGSDPTPDDDAEKKAMQDTAKKFGQACQQHSPDLVAHMSTEEVARDMDVLRSALKEEKLNFLGKSYGTFIGATYAGIFPKKVGRFVLDGVAAPEESSADSNLGQAEGFQRATEAYLSDCVGKGDCPMGATKEEGLKNLKELFASLDKKPIPVTNDDKVKELTEGWALLGVIAAMYSKNDWPRLTEALREAKDEKKGDKMMALANQYASRKSDGSYSSNLLQALPAVNCLDRPDSANLADYESRKGDFQSKSPTFGESMMWGGVACGVWPVQTGKKPAKIAAAGSDPILVVGTTRDPATPYEAAQSLADQLENGHLLSYDGDGHTAYYNFPDNNACVDGAVDEYLLDGKTPEKDKMCK